MKRSFTAIVLLGYASIPVAEAAPPAAWPEPVLIWAAGPMEVRAAFERPIDPEAAASLVGSKVAFQERGEGGRDGSLNVAAARLEDEGRTLVLVTDPHPRPADYSLPIPGDPPASLAYKLEGVEATWAEGDEEPDLFTAPLTWWPALDPAETSLRTRGSAEHERMFAQLAKPGRLAIRGALAVPRGAGKIEADASAPFRLSYGTDEVESKPGDGGRHRAVLEIEATGDVLDLVLMLHTGEGTSPPSLGVALTAAGSTARPLDGSTLLPAWVPPTSTMAIEVASSLDLAGGDRTRGDAVFFGDQAKCSACHTFGGKGGTIGPALDDVGRRGAAWIHRQIADPGAVIHPDYVTYTVALKGGQVVVGTVHAEGADSIRVADINAKSEVFPRSEIEELRPSGASIMPVGLAGAIGEARMRDLITYLLGPNPPR